MVDAISREAELEEVTDALLLSDDDDFNTLAAAELREELGHGHVFRIAPHPDNPDLLPPSREAGILADRSLTFGELDRQFEAGARLVAVTAGAEAPRRDEPTEVPLFSISPDGQLSIAADGRPPTVGHTDTVLVLVTRPRAPHAPA
jgi:hypothetical protein